MNSSTNVSVGPQRKSSNQNIQVYLRVRPLNNRERGIRSNEVVDVISPREIITRHTVDSKLTKKFTFDRTFGQESRQVDIYGTVVAPLIEEVLSGYNCTVFAYGQTGTGKTHTMIGTECAELKSSWEDDSDIGIIPRALSHLFDELRLMEVEFSMRISYLELYNEELCDLLSSDDSTKIRIFDDSTKKGSVIIQGLEEIPVHSKDDVYKLLEKGKERRKTATTLMNAQSSRSHTVFSILVHIRENGIDGEEMLKTGKLNLVDLAGSENVTKAGNEKGIRVRETVNINQSLLTLGRVITALVERTPHIPYRESKLTRLLQESLGGRTKTSIIATISPGHKDIEETLSTLEYAHRAKNIQNKPEVNQKLSKKTILKEYTEEIDKLKRDLMAARDRNGIYLAEETYSEMNLKLDSQNRELNEKMLLLKALKEELLNKENVFNEVSLNLVEKTEELKRTGSALSQTRGALQQTQRVLTTTKRRYKEKKVLLESHVKTEEMLSTQAAQILEVADNATKDTYQLHNTIERRKDVEKKLQTACEKFTVQMGDRFELMDENLANLQKQHKVFEKMLMQEFAETSKAQNELMANAKKNVVQCEKICSYGVEQTKDLSVKYQEILNDLSEEHRVTLKKLFEDLHNKEKEMRSQLDGEIASLKANNEQQKSKLDALRLSVAKILDQNSSELASHAQQLHQQLSNIAATSKASLAELTQLDEALAVERSIASEERRHFEEFAKRMEETRAKRTTCAEQMKVLSSKLQENGATCVENLAKGQSSVQDFSAKRSADNEAAKLALQAQTDEALVANGATAAKCAKMCALSKEQAREWNARIVDMSATEEHYCKKAQALLIAEEVEAVALRSQVRNEITSACLAIGGGLAVDTQRLKQLLALSMGFTDSMQKQVADYGLVYQEQMKNSVNDIKNFKHSELQTYASTGTTPSKRDFIYPRILAATSPHNQIVKRVRQENDWSDLDTTATIDEEGSEPEDHDSIQIISDTETISNSTRLESPSDSLRSNGLSSSRSSGNSLKPQKNHLRSSSLTRKNSPRTSPMKQTSPYIRENKENIN